MTIINASREQALADILQNGTTLYVALLTGMPDGAGAGAIEVNATGYARVAIAQWTNAEPVDTQTIRCNAGTVMFGSMSDVVEGLIGFAIFDAPSGGSIIAADLLRNTAGAVVSQTVPVGYFVRFQRGALCVAIGDASGDVTMSVTIGSTVVAREFQIEADTVALWDFGAETTNPTFTTFDGVNTQITGVTHAAERSRVCTGPDVTSSPNARLFWNAPTDTAATTPANGAHNSVFASSWTWEAWINPGNTSLAAPQTVIEFGTSGNVAISVKINTNESIEAGWNEGGGGTFASIVSGAFVITRSVWHHVAVRVVHAGPTQTMYLYLDGAIVGSGLSDDAVSLAGTAGFIWGNAHAGSEPFYGKIADEALYTVDRGSTNIAQDAVNTTGASAYRHTDTGATTYEIFRRNEPPSIPDLAGTLHAWIEDATPTSWPDVVEDIFAEQVPIVGSSRRFGADLAHAYRSGSADSVAGAESLRLRFQALTTVECSGVFLVGAADSTILRFGANGGAQEQNEQIAILYKTDRTIRVQWERGAGVAEGFTTVATMDEGPHVVGVRINAPLEGTTQIVEVLVDGSVIGTSGSITRADGGQEGSIELSSSDGALPTVGFRAQIRVSNTLRSDVAMAADARAILTASAV